MADMTQLATLGNLQRVVENMKVYVDSDKTTSIKGHLKKNNTHNFYNTSTPTEDTTPIFSFDVATEYFLDQTKTTFVQNFEWSDAIYTGSTNPNLEGKPVFVLAVKGDDMVSYSFVNLETLVDTYKTKNTTTLSLDITDNEISGNVNISTEDGNAVVVKDDGLYVPTTAEIKVSETDGNIIEVKDDGIYVAPTDLNEYAKTEDIPTVTNDLTDELKAQYDKAEENVQSDWNETDETSDAFIKNKPTIPSTDGLATETFVTDKIAEAQLGGEEVDLSGYVKQTDLVANYATKQELTNAIADVEVEVSQDTDNQIQTLDDGLFVGSETVTISKADYDALSVEEKSNGKTYFVPDDETTEDGTDLTQFAKVSDLEDGTITVGNSKKLNGLTKDELFAETNNKIKEINNNNSNIYNYAFSSSMFQYQREELRKNNKTIFMCFNNLITQSVADGDIIATLHTDCVPIIDIYGIPLFISGSVSVFGRLDINTNGNVTYHGTTFHNSWAIATGCWMSQ